MKNLLLCAAFAVSAFLMSSVVSAATVIITEGNRGLVAGSTTYSPIDAPGEEPGYDLETIGLNEAFDTIELHGRVVTDTDFFHFTAKSSFVMDYIFGGYDLQDGGSVAESGIVAEGTQGSTITLSLINTSGTGTSSIFSLPTNITSNESLFVTNAPGDYILSFAGQGVPVLYDIRITAVPLPAALPLMAAGMAIMGYFGWRRKKAVTA